MHADRYGRLWVATLAHGVLVVDLATGEWTRAHPGSVGAPGNLPAQPQLSLATTDHMLFVGTWGSGVYRAPLDEPEFRLLAPGADGGGLRDKNITAVLGRVAAGQPWVGSFGGGPQLVDVVAGSVVPTGGSPTDSILQAGVLSFAVTRDGSRFAGSTAGVYRFAEDGSNLGLEAYDADRPDGIGQGYVGALLPAGEAGLWVGVGGSGLFLRDAGSGRYRAYRHDPTVPDSLSGDYVTALAPGKSGYLWVGTRSNGLNLCRIEPWSCERFDGRSGGDAQPAAPPRDRAAARPRRRALGGHRRRRPAPRAGGRRWPRDPLRTLGRRTRPAERRDHGRRGRRRRLAVAQHTPRPLAPRPRDGPRREPRRSSPDCR